MLFSLQKSYTGHCNFFCDSLFFSGVIFRLYLVLSFVKNLFTDALILILPVSQGKYTKAPQIMSCQKLLKDL